MKSRIKLEWENVKNFISMNELDEMMPQIESAHHLLLAKKGRGADFLGWLDLPLKASALLQEIREESARICSEAENFLVIGIGGSYLGARAVIEAVGCGCNAPQIYFAGHNMSSDYIGDLLDSFKGKELFINVISKSGTTTEPGVVFRIFKEYMEMRYGREGASRRIIATTDATKGALRQMAKEEGYKTFIIPDDVGGRFSVLTPVGLLPIAVAGIDIEEILKGAASWIEVANNPEISENPSYLYAAIRNLLYRKGKLIEILGNWHPRLHYIAEWWKQLFGESEGKDGKGIFPASVDLTTDLHSLGQWIQEGQRILFETFLWVEKSKRELTIPRDKKDIDGLNYLAGMSPEMVNRKAYEGTALAHLEGSVPNMTIIIPELTPYYVGQIIYFFERAVAIGGYLLGVNPFDQPGVEAYKKNMFRLLGKLDH